MLVLLGLLAFLAAALSIIPGEQPPVRHDGASRTPPEYATEIERNLNECLLPKAQNGQYSSSDGGKSATALLEECMRELIPWVSSCTASGDTKYDCESKALMIAQFTIKSFNK